MLSRFSRLSTFAVIVILLMGALSTALVNAQTPDEETLVIGQSVDVSAMEPSLVTSRAEANIFGHLYATLYEIADDGTLQPYLANSYSISEDGKEWTFTLNEGLTCHDGEALTAEDVVYTLQRAVNPDNGFTGNTVGFVIPGVGYLDARADSDLEVTIVTDRYQSEPLRLGLLSEIYIHCKDSYEAMSLEEAAQNPIGSGPYQFVEWVRDDYVLIEKVEGYSLREPNFNQIYWRVIPEASTRTAELIAGNVDIIANVPPDQVDAVNNSGTAEVKGVQGTRRMYVGFNQRDVYEGEGAEAIRNTDVRIALQYAVDVETICSALLGVECERASSMVNPVNDNPDLEPYPYDPEMAEQLLDEAGFPRGEDGVRFEITLQGPRGRYLNDANVVQAIGQYLTDIGVQTTVEILDWSSEYSVLTRTHDVGPLFFLGTGGSTWSALYDMTDLSSPDAGTNYTEWNNEEWFTLWDSLADIRDGEEERAVIDQMLEVFYNDPPWLMLYFQPDFYGVSNRVAWTPRQDEQVIVYNAGLAE
ncbi:MAG: ABC transporter substrate-binding protein [Burkholderiales bacterium]|nr:ABC transporter substrate-binding protein [Anaerolineae bacterium]